MTRYSGGCQLDSSIVTEGASIRVHWKGMLAILGQGDRNPYEQDNNPTTGKHARQALKGEVGYVTFNIEVQLMAILHYHRITRVVR